MKAATLTQFRNFCKERKKVESVLTDLDRVKISVLNGRNRNPPVPWIKLYKKVPHHYKSFSGFYVGMRELRNIKRD